MWEATYSELHLILVAFIYKTLLQSVNFLHQLCQTMCLDIGSNVSMKEVLGEINIEIGGFWVKHFTLNNVGWP